MKIIGSDPNSRLNKFFDLVYCLLLSPHIIGMHNKMSSISLICRIDNEEPSDASRLKELFDLYGSDKATPNEYHRIYNETLAGVKDSLTTILEIGIGTNDESLVSNMGKNGRPGASLRAFRDWAPNAQVYGADVDEKTLFDEDRIHTFYVNQLSLRSFDKLIAQLPQSLDLIVIDGLHTPRADFNSIIKLLPKLSIGGYMFVEDIGDRASIFFWPIFIPFIKKICGVNLLRRRNGNMLILHRTIEAKTADNLYN